MDLKKIKLTKTVEELLQFGVINLDKPTGPTSFSTSNFVRKSLGLKKTSHFGTLDPMVTGVLPVGLNRACRLNEFLMHRDKTYVGIIRTHKEISKKELEKVIKDFLGKIVQLPPVRSRVKRAEREREIKTLKILEQKEKDFLFETKVQAGTYIRKLVHDIGEKIGGAHMLELRRTQAGIFGEEGLVNLYQLEEAIKEYKNDKPQKLKEILIPGEIVTTLYQTLQIKEEFIQKCLNGSPLFGEFVKNIPSLEEEEIICVVSKEKLIGIYKTQKQNDILAKPLLVIN